MLLCALLTVATEFLASFITARDIGGKVKVLLREGLIKSGEAAQVVKAKAKGGSGCCLQPPSSPNRAGEVERRCSCDLRTPSPAKGA